MTETTKEIANVLATERAAFETMRENLTKHHNEKYVVIVGDELQGAFDSFDSAAKFAKTTFGRGPYLIRQVGTPVSMSMPASVAFRPTHANP